MKIRIKLLMLILSTTLSFILSIGIYLYLLSGITAIEQEKQILQNLKQTALTTGRTGAEILLRDNAALQWDALTEEVRELEEAYRDVCSLRILPGINRKMADALDSITALRQMEQEAYSELSSAYIRLVEELADSTSYKSPEFRFIQLYSDSIQLGRDRSMILRLYAQEFENALDRFNMTLDSSAGIIDSRFHLIEEEVRQIQRGNILLAAVLCAALIFITILSSLTLANNIGKDTQKITRALSLMVDESSPVSLDISRKDEIGIMAKDIETISARLMETRGQLIQSEKMASLGELVAGVAHEINTPIGIGVTASSFLDNRTSELGKLLEAEELTREDLENYIRDARDSSEMILANMQRAADLIRSFKQVAVDQTSRKMRRFEIREYTKEVMRSLQPMFKNRNHNVRIHCPGDFEVTSYPGALSQVLTNLVVNSLVHGFEELESGEISIGIRRRDEHILITYQDTGCGIPEENLKKIYDPFFTTKRGRNGGTGLGLHIVFNLVSQTLKGKIRCTSPPGEGARFEIEFPSLESAGRST